MVIRKRPKNIRSSDRILQSEIIQRIQREYGVSHPTAMNYLRREGPAPVARLSSKTVFYRRSEIEQWLGKDE